MKNIFSNKCLISACAVLCFLVGLTGVTYAYYQKVTDKKSNTFTIGDVTTEIQEEFEITDSGIVKKPSVVNTGTNSCIIRMRVVISPSDAAEVTGFDADNWKKEADGYYYYQKAVDPGEKTTPVFTGVTVREGFSGDVEVTCYQEAVQSEATIENATVTDMMSIWESYDNERDVFNNR